MQMRLGFKCFSFLLTLLSLCDTLSPAPYMHENKQYVAFQTGMGIARPRNNLVGCDDYICVEQVLNICVPVAAMVDLYSKGTRICEPSNLCLPLADSDRGKHDQRPCIGVMNKKDYLFTTS